jgi:hypothetical protein
MMNQGKSALNTFCKPMSCKCTNPRSVCFSSHGAALHCTHCTALHCAAHSGQKLALFSAFFHAASIPRASRSLYLHHNAFRALARFSFCFMLHTVGPSFSSLCCMWCALARQVCRATRSRSHLCDCVPRAPVSQSLYRPRVHVVRFCPTFLLNSTLSGLD